MNFGYDWDGFSKKLTLRTKDKDIILSVGSHYVLVNDRIEDIENPVCFHDNMVIVPHEFAKGIDPYRQIKAESYPIYPWLNTIILDAGHGGKDPGAVGKGGLLEKDVVIDIAKKLKNLLIARGFDVVMTRGGDDFVSLSKRAQIANENDGDLFISLHANASRSRSARGLEVFYLSENNDTIESSSDHVDAILSELIDTANRYESIEVANHIADSLGEKLFVRNRGVKRAEFFVLKGVKMPAILIETGFISNRNEEKNLANKHYKDMIAEVVCSGIMEFKREFERDINFSVVKKDLGN